MVRQTTRRAIKAARKVAALIIGLPIVVVGIILIPLPGPGLIITFIGLFILSLEFDGAKKYTDQIRDKLAKIINDTKSRLDDK